MPLGKQDFDLAESLRSLRGGGLPTRAKLRLAEEAGPHRKLFTSDLSTNELLLAREIGLEPISQVMGSSIYHIGRIADYKGKTGEIETISSAHREARRLALRRLALEADAVAADVVLGVHLAERLITKGAHGKGGDDGDEVIEFTVVGTAAKAPWLERRAKDPVLTDLSGQDLWALARDGWAPCGMVFDFCRYHVWHVMKQDSWSAGGEVRSATAGVDQARDLVAGRVTQWAKQTGAEYVVGSDITVKVHEIPCGWEGCPLNDLDIDVSWFATGVKRMHNAAEIPHPGVPPLILGMMPLGKKKRGALLEGIESEDEELRAEAREEEERAAEKDEGGE
jgi:uncharacterized protein YbjQ (UPF0145 family)